MAAKSVKSVQIMDELQKHTFVQKKKKKVYYPQARVTKCNISE